MTGANWTIEFWVSCPNCDPNWRNYCKIRKYFIHLEQTENCHRFLTFYLSRRKENFICSSFNDFCWQIEKSWWTVRLDLGDNPLRIIRLFTLRWNERKEKSKNCFLKFDIFPRFANVTLLKFDWFQRKKMVRLFLTLVLKVRFVSNKNQKYCQK